MTTKKWYHNAKTGKVSSYLEYDNGETSFIKGELIVYDDYLTVGFLTAGEALEWAKEWGCCDKCKGSSKPNEIGNCFRCGNPVHFVPVVFES